MGHDLDSLPPWEALLKRVLWIQIGQLSNKRILDFGSGIGVTANHYAADNAVVAVEPSEESVRQRWNDHLYRQIVGSTEALREMESESFDVIFCHNVLEYAEEYAEKHIPGAVLLPDYEINERTEEELTDKDQLVLVYCRSGRRSKNAAAILVELGYTNIKEFGGIIDWPYEVE